MLTRRQVAQGSILRGLLALDASLLSTPTLSLLAILSKAKDLARRTQRSFVVLRMTTRISNQLAGAFPFFMIAVLCCKERTRYHRSRERTYARTGDCS